MSKFKILDTTRIIPNGYGESKPVDLTTFISLLTEYWARSIPRYKHCEAEIFLRSKVFRLTCYSSFLFFWGKPVRSRAFKLKSLDEVYVFVDNFGDIIDEGTAIINALNNNASIFNLGR